MGYNSKSAMSFRASIVVLIAFAISAEAAAKDKKAGDEVFSGPVQLSRN
jgi:hypothetical protein